MIKKMVNCNPIDKDGFSILSQSEGLTGNPTIDTLITSTVPTPVSPLPNIGNLSYSFPTTVVCHFPILQEIPQLV